MVSGRFGSTMGGSVAAGSMPDRRRLAGRQEEPVSAPVAIYGTPPNERIEPYQTGR